MPCFATFYRNITGCFALALLLMPCACGGSASAPPAPPALPAFTTLTGPPRDSERFLNKKYLSRLPYNFQVPADDDELGWRVLADYGSVYAAQGGVIPPPTVQFANEAETAAWQAGLAIERFDFGEEKYGNFVELQARAMTAYKEAREEVETIGLSLTPRGSDAGRRSFEATVKLWQNGLKPGFEHWLNAKRLTNQEVERLRALPPAEQVREILRLEAQGLFFGKDFDKSILATISAPGTSQHLSLLALDLYEYENYDVRLILARHGWYQTIPADLPHFTYLGVREGQLPTLGLKRIIRSERAFWVPDVK